MAVGSETDGDSSRCVWSAANGGRTLETDGKNKQETAGHWRKSVLFQRECVQTVSDRLQCSEFVSIER